MNTQKILSAIQTLQTSIQDKFDTIEKDLTEIKSKCEQMETRIMSGGGVGGGGGGSGTNNIAIVTSISTPEEKIKVLNESTNISQQEDFIEALESRCRIEDSNIHCILSGNMSIYETIVEIIHEFDSESDAKYIYAFSTPKSVIYMWNNKKGSWAKMSKSQLLSIFTTIQMKIISKYQFMMNNDKRIKSGCVDDGDLIYVEDFDKQYSEFRKMLFAKMV